MPRVCWERIFQQGGERSRAHNGDADFALLVSTYRLVDRMLPTPQCEPHVFLVNVGFRQQYLLDLLGPAGCSSVHTAR